MNLDEIYMRRCIELARLAEGNTSPNPMVGSVIVHNNCIIGEGYHHKAGEPHAEVMAIRSVKDESLLPESTLYVNLEPCSHYGKTPPCSELIINKKIKRVVIAMTDPFPQVSGKGIKMLREAGVEVVCGILEHEAAILNKTFLTYQIKKRPFITLKWAESLDGFIDRLRDNRDIPAFRFSSGARQREVHRLRYINDAILVGQRTAYLDNPELTDRYWNQNKQPLRIVIDRENELDRDLKLFDDSTKTWIVTEEKNLIKNEKFDRTYFKPIIFSPNIAEEVTDLLYREGIQSILVEGGAYILQQFLDKQMYDELIIEKSPILLGKGVTAPKIKNT
ncbi:bifunctional diaminohydroxyphosphoribosylaminopyrimidine deaminase/5-amino-6-(5-phosphoribosylamino)uracil reductase RibD [Porphyromonas pogonae]|uniref:bifunctional diaminohydroxyphosphoribosylaminopyrimidine deaminase/5-amino-6-(5-phosphoribosylamino)uracil reductase RibD n=1 Tax=Porphyromonas pogonae TaxID=867595 RepID=UPI002E75FEA7|nr:bifunctional diaminohydroxyphosphoribosylaminopyrimidine deaminase/5-amino-6-(5-phosphoribosylamino)uracil reductase RibD [Porphyromonas pogonae]